MRITAFIAICFLCFTTIALASAPCGDCGGKTTSCKSTCGSCTQKCYPTRPCEATCASKCKPKTQGCGQCCDDPWTEGFNEFPMVADSVLPPADCCLGSEFCLVDQVCWDLKFDWCCIPTEYELLCQPCKCEPVKCGPKCSQDTCTRPDGKCGGCR